MMLPPQRFFSSSEIWQSVLSILVWHLLLTILFGELSQSLALLTGVKKISHSSWFPNSYYSTQQVLYLTHGLCAGIPNTQCQLLVILGQKSFSGSALESPALDQFIDPINSGWLLVQEASCKANWLVMGCVVSGQGLIQARY